MTGKKKPPVKDMHVEKEVILKPAVEKPVDLDREIADFLVKSLLPFHAMLSQENMYKKLPEFDVVIDRLAQSNTLLSNYLRGTK